MAAHETRNFSSSVEIIPWVTTPYELFYDEFKVKMLHKDVLSLLSVT